MNRTVPGLTRDLCPDHEAPDQVRGADRFSPRCAFSCGMGARPVNPAIYSAATDAIPTKYRRDTAWDFALLTYGLQPIRSVP